MVKNKKQKSFKKRLINRGIVVASLVIFLIIISILAKNTAVAEFMTRNVSRFLLRFAGTVTSIFPFSVLEILLIIGVILLFTGIIIFFVRIKRRGKDSLLRLIDCVAVVLSVVIFYQICVGFAYHRAPLDLSSKIKEVDDNYAALAATYFTEDFINLANTLERDERGCVVSPYTTSELNKKLREEFNRLDNGYLNPYTPKFKKIKLGFVMAELKIVGVFVGPLGEANVTGYALDYEVPLYAAHEIAHAKGVMRESEADLVAAYLLLTSDDPYLRYSAYMFNYYSYLLLPIYLTNNDLYKQLSDSIPEIVRTEMMASYEIYSKYNLLDNLGEKINDLYLKLNGQKKGTGSYDDYGETIVTEPTEPDEPPVYTHYFSQTEKILISICPL